MDQSVVSALDGLRVVDVSRVIAGPYCAQMLSDHGAQVIKVEPPLGDETRLLGPPFIGESAAYYYGFNRNKEAIALDLTKPDAREVLLRLLDGADVLIENFLAGTMEGWGLGYREVLADRFPRLIYCRVTGFGLDGPLGKLPGYDAVLQAMGGLMSVNGHPDTGTTRVGVPIIDLTTGMSTTIAVLLAIVERERSGKGQYVETALYDSALSLLHPHASNYFASGRPPQLTGSAHPNIATYDKFAVDGSEIFLGMVNDGQFEKFCKVLDREDLFRDPRFVNNTERLKHRVVLRQELEKALAGRDAATLCAELMKAGVPAGPVHSVPQAVDHPHTKARDMSVEIDGYRGLGVLARLSRTPGKARTAPPKFAQHTDEVLRRFGYSDAQIAALRQSGAVLDRPVNKRKQS